MNNITIFGRLGQDPDSFKYNGRDGEQTGARFSVAVDKPRRGGQQQDPDWFSVSVFGGQAASVLQYLAKGRQVVVSGRMESNKVDKDGTTVTYWGITANDVKFVSDGQAQQGQNSSNGSDVTPAPAAPKVPAPF
jgi:single-strand DNA-binding protein